MNDKIDFCGQIDLTKAYFPETFRNQRMRARENDYIAFDEYYNEPIGRSFGNCEIPFVTS